MAPYQTILTPDRSRDADLRVIANPSSEPPWVIADREGGQPPLFASRDILRIANFAKKQDFEVQRFEVVDARFALLAEPEQTEVSDHLVEVFREDGQRGVQVLLHTSYRSRFLSGVELWRPGGLRVTVRNDGVVIANDAATASGLLNLAWHSLTLS